MPIGINNVADSLVMYGPHVSRLIGGNIRDKNQPRVGEGGTLEIPRYLYRLNKLVTLTADVMFVSSIPFLVTLSRKIRVVTA